jgi:hypothetical protein
MAALSAHRFVSVVAVLTVTAVGCSKAPAPWEQVYPASGTVLFKGKPLAGAVITLVPTDASFPSSVRPSATSKEDGSFALGTYSTADGAPATEYKALVLHYPVVGPKDNPSAGPNDLPRKYARAESTDLRIVVSPENSELPPLVIK